MWPECMCGCGGVRDLVYVHVHVYSIAIVLLSSSPKVIVKNLSTGTRVGLKSNYEVY